MACFKFICLQSCLNISAVRFMLPSDTNVFIHPNSSNAILAVFTRSSAARQSAFFHNGSTMHRSVLFLTKKNISHNYLPWLAWYFIWDCLLMWSCLLILQACGILLYSVLDVCLHIHPNHQLPGLKSHLFNAHLTAVQLLQYLSL